jgi:type IV secretion system protein VirD4
MGRKLLKPEEVTGLPDRVAITFIPGVLPIATRLIRYYENDFRNQRPMGPIKMAFKAACMFFPAAFLALAFTVAARVDAPRERSFPRGHGQIRNSPKVLPRLRQ